MYIRFDTSERVRRWSGEAGSLLMIKTSLYLSLAQAALQTTLVLQNLTHSSSGSSINKDRWVDWDGRPSAVVTMLDR